MTLYQFMCLALDFVALDYMLSIASGSACLLG